jgi:hypothetical protein
MNGEQQPHDAQKTLTDLRDHLARHDKPIAFFFGAGTSCDLVAWRLCKAWLDVDVASIMSLERILLARVRSSD